MIYYRDPLLDKICDRILDLSEPAFIKNSELVFVAVNDAFASLFNLAVSDLVGTSGEGAELEALLDIEDKERACLVFGEDQIAAFADPFGKGRFRVEMERFTLADGQTFLYCVFGGEVAAAMSGGEGVGAPVAAGVPKTEERAEATPLTSELAALVVESLVGGICIYNDRDELIYFNERLQALYSPLIGDLKLGMTLREVLVKIADNYIRTKPGDPFLNDANRERWIAQTIEFQRLANSMDMMPLSDGKWLQCINRRLPSGIFIGLRVDVTEMKEQEALLEKRVEEVGLYRELLNLLPVAAFARGPDQRLAVVNQAYAELFGRKIEDLIGTAEAELLGEYAGPVSAANNDTLVNGVGYEREEDMPVADGRIASTIVRTGRLITENGTPYVVGTVIDISTIRQRELMLQQANEKAEAIRRDFEDIISAMDVGLVVLDRDLNVLLINEAYKQKIWGKGAEQWTGGIVGRPLREFLLDHFNNNRRVHPTETFEDYYQRRIAEIRSGRIEAREAVLQNGAVIFYSGIPLSDGKFMLCYFDMTELRKRDAEVATAHRLADKAYRLVRNATDTMPEGLMVIEGEQIVFANPSLASVINVPQELLAAGGPWEDVFRATSLQNPVLDEATIEDGLQRFREAMAQRKDVSYSFPLDDERWVRLEMRSRDDGQSVLLCSDQTTTMRREAELKRLIAKAEAADRAKSEFLANMSLEIRTPMNGILGMAELLVKSSLDTRQKAFIEIIMKSGNALLTIINDILDFSKLDAGHMQLKYLPFDPGEAIEDVASLFATKAAEKDIELIVKRAGNIPATIMGDAGRFRQIVSNLISNAVKFTEQGFVSASIGTVSNGLGQTILSVMIEDTGAGIPADKLTSIFEKFSQIEISSSRRDGVGLGLAIAQRLASVQGGDLSVHSSEGKGSIFTLTLPVQIAAETHRPKALPANVEGARVLIVDNHEVTRDHLLDNAGEWGFECVGTGDAMTGLSILGAAADSGVAVDAVLIDCHLPEMSGIDMVRCIRADSRLDGLAIILLTSQNIAACEALAADIKVAAYLTKPIRVPLLRDTLVDVIRAFRAGATAHTESVISLPRSRTAPPAAVESGPGLAAANAEPQPLSEPRKPYVLVVEDNEVNQIFFSQIMEAAGLSYRIVGDGQSAVEAWEDATPSIILMDTAMPVLDGFAATRRIRAMEAMTGAHTPIVGVITHSRDSHPDLCIAAGMDDHISKPVSPERLEEKIRHWTGREFHALASRMHPA